MINDDAPDWSIEKRRHAVMFARNPYRIEKKRTQFDAMLGDFVTGRNFLFHANGRENRLNNIGEAFWRGVHGERFIWDSKAPIHVAYRAGVAVRHATSAIPQASVSQEKAP